MSDEIIHNPAVPYSTHFHSDIKNGTVIVIRGTVLPSADGFFFHFQCGTLGKDDIAFNFNPRFNEGHVLFNTREKNVWSPDENRYKVPFAMDQPFEIQVLVTDQEYKVFVDKTFFLDYPHKIPLSRVCAFQVKGDVTLSRVEIQPQMVPFHHYYFPGGQQENTVPFGTQFPSDIKVGTVFIINGTVPPLSDRFYMNFMCGSDVRDDIAFHFNPRFNEGKLICNTKRSNAFDINEERAPLPLEKEQAFELRFLVEDHAYQISLNGDHLFDYSHRLSPDTIKTLVIMGCVLLNSVEIQAEASGFHHLYFQDEKIPKSLPVVTPFLVGIRENTMVRIRGTVLPATKKFSIDMQCGDKDNDDIAFHLNIFIAKGNVSCNTMENEIWGNEELKEEMPFKKGEPFEVRILFASQEYKVSVDRNRFLEYGHRIPVERVNTLAVHGRITVNAVEIQSQGPIPYLTHFHSGMNNGTLLIISGTVLPTAERFSVNIKCGTVEDDDIALHFNPRFDEQRVICNSRENSVWGQVIEKSPVPFLKGQFFKIEVLVTVLAYKVSVNDNPFVYFPHRIALQRVNTLELMGDISLQRVEIQSQGVGFHHHYFPGGNQENTVPFGTQFPAGLRPGAMVTIKGAIQPLADRFSVNFKCGASSIDDIAFHFNPRFDEGRIICTTRKDGIFGLREETPGVPFTVGQPFELQFQVTDQGYGAYVNGNHILDYNHRIPLDQVNTLVIMGCVSLNSVEIQAEAAGFQHTYFQDEQIQNSVPFATDFLGGVKDSTVVIINGDIRTSTNSFNINFQTGSDVNDDIALHFNPRIDEGFVVCNTRQNGIWGTEERKFQVPFTKGQPFEIRILITGQDYKVSVGRSLFIEYAHRIPKDQVKTLAVNGDIALKSVKIEEAAFP